MPYIGQELFLAAAATRGLDTPAYRDAQSTIARFRTRLAEAFADGRLAALVAPTNARAWRTTWATGDRFSVGSSSLAAVSGFAAITVPAELADELPLGVSFVAPPGGDARLLEIAAAFEAARAPLPAPRFLETVAD
jgi:amidase